MSSFSFTVRHRTASRLMNPQLTYRLLGNFSPQVPVNAGSRSKARDLILPNSSACSLCRREAVEKVSKGMGCGDSAAQPEDRDHNEQVPGKQSDRLNVHLSKPPLRVSANKMIPF
jgi:hypothetical protein